MLAFVCTSATAGYDEALAAYNKDNFKVAAKEFSKLAKQGNAKAQYNLGWMYSHGEGVPKDDKLAAKWYRLLNKAK